MTDKQPSMWALVYNDMGTRDDYGNRQYGRPLAPRPGFDALKEAYEEALDLVVYLRTALYERDGR